MAPESPRKRLPFEPVGNKGVKAPVEPKTSAKPTAAKGSGKTATPIKKASAAKKTSTAKQSAGATAIPEVVSNRMLRRMLAFSGVPTVTGILTFFVSYYLVVNQVVELPSYFVLLITLACFGLGVVGLTYGVLSASWDEDRPGTRLGLDEFRLNFGRITSAWGTKSER